MKVLVSPEFNTKLAALETDAIHSLSAFISYAEKYDKNEFLSTKSFNLSLLENEIFSAKLSTNRVYFTVGKDEQGDYLVLLDIVTTQSTPASRASSFFTVNNPKKNSSLNPKLNSSINPKLNSSINPKLNTSLNPRFNRSYGGPYLYDLSLNQDSYLVKANDKVDLRFTSTAEFASFLVSARENIKIEFDKDNNWVGYFVKANDNVWLKYSLNNEWQGLLI